MKKAGFILSAIAVSLAAAALACAAVGCLCDAFALDGESTETT